MNEDMFRGFAAALVIAGALLLGAAFGYESGIYDGVIACKAQIDTRCQPKDGQP